MKFRVLIKSLCSLRKYIQFFSTHYVPQTFQILTAWSTHTHTHTHTHAHTHTRHTHTRHTHTRTHTHTHTHTHKHAHTRYKKWLHLHLFIWLSSKWRLGDLWSICSDRCFSLHSQIWKQLFFFLKTYTYIHKETDISTQYPHCSPQGYTLQCFNWKK